VDDRWIAGSVAVFRCTIAATWRRELLRIFDSNQWLMMLGFRVDDFEVIHEFRSRLHAGITTSEWAVRR